MTHSRERNLRNSTTRLIQHALSEGLTKGVKPVINSPAVTHLFFADDWPLFTEAKGVLLAAKTISTEALDIDQAKALAVLERLKWAQQIHCKKLTVQADNKGVAEAVSNLELFDYCSVNYINRTCNHPAHVFAKFALKNLCNTVWRHSS
ncbi:uncharacterized protein LOC113356100 isoform X2 [Papaver somniferum]|uniref:uncharacterized protein LOC113356100 isoform X2 n=1 Tax=Papaver somniferum TaxID=3469 RepID=UPI000E6F8985|nr:uncharacterized protein LOC113356100 isoform X2 [Papaver somniferum]XP_026454902.1 uncharacterized protein LOC113356100 isoform X2 [Papaver somniferum]XP_026454903.1 uncharacterized protein LOC113356100 isoform X2 [Papaver somniferum]XP_026454904.1 uncharacterized protein LOC113356100 isoform X2 [Papaver somniferum]XP_026454905.1 uncharacterized protein LOC113356100 isoform X2 [Papaver somniferum]